MTESSAKLLVAREGGVKRVTINRPERRNSLDGETLLLLQAAVRESAADGTRVVVLAGAGDSFCAGADLAATSADEIAGLDVTARVREEINPVVLSLRALPVPVVARVHGHAVGIGFNFALACDLVVASEQATFGQAFVKIGLMPDGGGTYFLPRLVGYHKAFELMATGDAVTAQEALRLGLVNRVVPVSELDATVNALAARLAASPRVALAKMKAALNRDGRAGRDERSELAAALDFEAVNQAACARAPDFLEGVTAFLQKRRPSFGRDDEGRA